MITFEDLEIGKFYTTHDDCLFKVVDKGKNWYLVLSYSYNHHVFNPILYPKEEMLEDYNKDLEEVENDLWYYENLFNNAEYVESFSLCESNE